MKHSGAPPSQTLSEDLELQLTFNLSFHCILKPVACVSEQDRRLRKLGKTSPNCICLTLWMLKCLSFSGAGGCLIVASLPLHGWEDKNNTKGGHVR